MERAVRTAIAEHGLFERGDRVVVAVSGGMDSVVLLDLLAGLDALRLGLTVAHLNHQLRGEASDGDERFVKELATRYGLPVATRRVDVSALARERRLSLEEAGREARYAFFADVVRESGARCAALAHHRDDQAETVLMRLLRGAGGTGLAGMRWKSAGGRIVRPLLDVGREEIAAWAVRRGLSWHEDATNADPRFLRNRLRHEVLPLLARLNPSVAEHLAVTARTLAADEELLDHLVDGAFGRLGTTGTDGVTLDAAGVALEARALRMRVYRRAIALAKGDLARIATVHLEAVDRLVISPRPNATLDLPAGVTVYRSYGAVRIAAAPPSPQTDAWELEVPGPGRYPLPGGGTLFVSFSLPPATWTDQPPTVAYLDPVRGAFPWRVRPFRPGDRLTPLGMAGTKKVKDLFIDEKVPLRDRRRLPLLFGATGLLWVCGVRLAEGARITSPHLPVIRAELLDFTP